MKYLSILWIVIFSIFSFSTDLSGIAVVVSPQVEVHSVYELSTDDILSLDRHALQQKIGRKLKFKERIALKMVKRKLKKNAKLTPDEAKAELGTSGMAVASFVLGLLSLFVAGIILGVLAIIFSAIALNKIRENPGMGGKGLAIAGLVLGIVGVVGALVVLSTLS